MAPKEHPRLKDLKDQIGKTLDVFYDAIGTHHHAVSGHVTGDYHAPSDIVEQNTSFEIRIELPGFALEDLSIDAGENWLSVRGATSREHEEKGKNYLLRERRFGRFERRFATPAGCDPEHAEAVLELGVLTITIPRKPETQATAKRIEVKHG